MTLAQKTAQANFKKAIAYRKKTGCSLKQAFAHVKGGMVKGLEKVVKKGSKTTVLYSKKTTTKKAAPKKKTTQGKLFGVTHLTYKNEVKKYITKLEDCTKEIARVENDILDLKKMAKENKSIEGKKADLKLLDNFKMYLSALKSQKIQLKKLI